MQVVCRDYNSSWWDECEIIKFKCLELGEWTTGLLEWITGLDHWTTGLQFHILIIKVLDGR